MYLKKILILHTTAIKIYVVTTNGQNKWVVLVVLGYGLKKTHFKLFNEITLFNTIIQQEGGLGTLIDGDVVARNHDPYLVL